MKYHEKNHKDKLFNLLQIKCTLITHGSETESRANEEIVLVYKSRKYHESQVEIL